MCFDSLKAPKKIFQCSQGHYVCDLCVGKLRKGNNECPTCRENWANEPNLPARNRLAEELIQKMAAKKTESIPKVEPNEKKRKYNNFDEIVEKLNEKKNKHEDFVKKGRGEVQTIVPRIVVGQGHPQGGQPQTFQQMQVLRPLHGQLGPASQPGQADGAAGQPKSTMVQSLQQLITALKNPNYNTQQQQQQVKNILKAKPDLMAAFLKRRNQQQQQGGASGQQGSQQVATSSRAPEGPPQQMQPQRPGPQYQQYHPRPPQPGQPQGQPITVQGQPGQQNEVRLNVEHHFMDNGKVVKKVGSFGANTGYILCVLYTLIHK